MPAGDSSPGSLPARLGGYAQSVLYAQLKKNASNILQVLDRLGDRTPFGKAALNRVAAGKIARLVL